jgi:hypothetical protein
LVRPLLALLALAALGARPAPQLAGDIRPTALIIGSCALTGGTGRLNGQVTLPGPALLPSARVSLYTADGRFVSNTTTDGAGGYRFNGLKTGSYLLYARPGPSEPAGADYAAEWYDNQSQPASATPLFISEGVTMTANIELALGTRISGQVMAAEGGPLAGVYVAVYDELGEYAASDYTDASGQYTTSPGLASGQYQVSFVPVSGPYLEAAAAVAVSAPNAYPNLDALLARAAQITGQVTHAVTGAPVQASVLIQGTESSDIQYTDSNGVYTTTAGLRSGVYTVTFRERGLPSLQNLYGSSQVVTLTAPNRVTVNGTLSPAGQIAGRVTNAGGAPLPGVGVYVFGDDLRHSEYALTDASGLYTATALPSGAYSLLFQRQGYISEYYDDKRDSGQRDRVMVTEPYGTSGIDAVLAPGGSLSGTVTAADTGLPLASVRVTAFDAAGEYQGQVVTDAGGQYLLPDLPSGPYRLSFEPAGNGPACGYQEEWYNDKATLAMADPVFVTAPTLTANANVALSRGSALLGQVVYAATAAPLEGVSVLVYDTGGRVAAEGFTNFLGYFLTSPALPSGVYRVRFTDGEQGNIDEYFNDKLTWDSADVVTVTAPNDVTGISAALLEGGTVYGRVTAADTGAGVPGVEVTVYDASGQVVGEARTASDGTYAVLNGLPTGDYRLRFASSAGHNRAVQAATGPWLNPELAPPLSPPPPETLPAGAMDEPAFGQSPLLGLERLRPQSTSLVQTGASTPYLTQFFSNKLTLAVADLVPVTAPIDLRDIDVVLQRGVFLPLLQR